MNYEKMREELVAHVKCAREIADTADREGRDLTADERRDVEAHVEQAKTLKRCIEKGQVDQRMRRTLASLDDHRDDGSTFTHVDPVTGHTVEIDARTGGPAAKAAYRGRAGAWAKTVADRLTAAARHTGVKALTTGSIDVPSPVTTGVVALPQQPRVLDLVVDRQALTSTTFEYLRQTARNNNAAPVADGGTKPTSAFTVTPIEDRARVVAHLSEPFPERYLADYQALTRWLDEEMNEGVLQAIEGEMLSGDGTGEHFTGVLNTSGVVAVAWNTDLFRTVRKARTAMELLGERPTAWVMNPADLETVDLTTDDMGRYYLTGGGGDGKIDALFGGLPRIPSNRIPAGTAILADWTQSRLLVREDVRLDMDKSGTLFQTNQVVLRAEGRFGWAVLRPQAFAVVDLTP